MKGDEITILEFCIIHWHFIKEIFIFKHYQSQRVIFVWAGVIKMEAHLFCEQDKNKCSRLNIIPDKQTHNLHTHTTYSTNDDITPLQYPSGEIRGSATERQTTQEERVQERVRKRFKSSVKLWDSSRSSYATVRLAHRQRDPHTHTHTYMSMHCWTWDTKTPASDTLHTSHGEGTESRGEESSEICSRIQHSYGRSYETSVMNAEMSYVIRWITGTHINTCRWRKTVLCLEEEEETMFCWCLVGCVLLRCSSRGLKHTYCNLYCLIPSVPCNYTSCIFLFGA